MLRASLVSSACELWSLCSYLLLLHCHVCTGAGFYLPRIDLCQRFQMCVCIPSVSDILQEPASLRCFFLNDIPCLGISVSTHYSTGSAVRLMTNVKDSLHLFVRFVSFSPWWSWSSAMAWQSPYPECRE